MKKGSSRRRCERSEAISPFITSRLLRLYRGPRNDILILMACFFLLFPLTLFAADFGDAYVDSSIGDASILNPVLLSDSASNDIAGLVFNGLVKYDKNIQLVGDLAESWQVSPGGLVITFHLRKGVLWHDGQPFTAEDVLFTYQKLRDPKVHPPMRVILKTSSPSLLQTLTRFASPIESRSRRAWPPGESGSFRNTSTPHPGLTVDPLPKGEGGRRGDPGEAKYDFNTHPANRRPIETCNPTGSRNGKQINTSSWKPTPTILKENPLSNATCTGLSRTKRWSFWKCATSQLIPSLCLLISTKRTILHFRTSSAIPLSLFQIRVLWL